MNFRSGSDIFYFWGGKGNFIETWKIGRQSAASPRIIWKKYVSTLERTLKISSNKPRSNFKKATLVVVSSQFNIFLQKYQIKVKQNEILYSCPYRLGWFRLCLLWIIVRCCVPSPRDEFCVVFEILMSDRQSLVYTVDLTMQFTFCLFPIFLVDNIVNMNCNFIIVHCMNHFCVCRSLQTVSREHP